jgi:hypothetical protein
LRESGWGSPNSDEGTYTAVLYKYKYLVLLMVKFKEGQLGDGRHWRFSRKTALGWGEGGGSRELRER